MYDRERVAALCRWPMLGLGDLDGLFPHGVFIARRHQPVDQPDGWRSGWALSFLTPSWLRFWTERHGPLPFIGVVCGFVTFAADLTSAEQETGRTYALSLAPAGGWADAVRDHRLHAPGGKTFMIRGWTSATGPLTPGASATLPATARAGSRAGR
jgi:hypothetical protein